MRKIESGSVILKRMWKPVGGRNHVGMNHVGMNHRKNLQNNSIDL